MTSDELSQYSLQLNDSDTASDHLPLAADFFSPSSIASSIFLY